MLTIKDVTDIKECPDCASLNIVYSQQRDQVICKECGVIFEPMVPLEGTPPIDLFKTKTGAAKKKPAKKAKPKKRK